MNAAMAAAAAAVVASNSNSSAAASDALRNRIAAMNSSGIGSQPGIGSAFLSVSNNAAVNMLAASLYSQAGNAGIEAGLQQKKKRLGADDGCAIRNVSLGN